MVNGILTFSLKKNIIAFKCGDVDGFSPQVTRAALVLVTLSVRCGLVFYQVAVFGPLFQVNLLNDPLMDEICTGAVFLQFL